MKKQDGFTLVELLGVVTILVMIGAIIIPVINNVINDNKESLYDTQIKNIELGASNFVSENVFTLELKKGEKIGITLGKLQDMGYLKEDLYDPIKRKKFERDLLIVIENEDSGYTYLVCTEEVNCDLDITMY